MHDTSLEPEDTDATRGISIHAGFPNPATDKRLTGLDLNQLLIQHPASTFLFRIRGEQGTSRGIFDGDIALIDRAAALRPSDLVLWHNGQGFRLSTARHIDADGSLWGIVTAIIHPYRTTGNQA